MTSVGEWRECRCTLVNSSSVLYKGSNYMMSIWFFRMNHRLSFDEQRKKVIDANIKDLARYEIFDPRNPLTKRRRELSKKAMEEASKRQRHM